MYDHRVGSNRKKPPKKKRPIASRIQMAELLVLRSKHITKWLQYLRVVFDSQRARGQDRFAEHCWITSKRKAESVFMMKFTHLHSECLSKVTDFVDFFVSSVCSTKENEPFFSLSLSRNISIWYIPNIWFGLHKQVPSFYMHLPTCHVVFALTARRARRTYYTHRDRDSKKKRCKQQKRIGNSFARRNRRRRYKRE